MGSRAQGSWLGQRLDSSDVGPVVQSHQKSEVRECRGGPKEAHARVLAETASRLRNKRSSGVRAGGSGRVLKWGR